MLKGIGSISRRGFVAGAVGAAACAAGAAGAAVAEEGVAEAAEGYAARAAEELEADVVVVGGGVAGLCAAVEAAELGARTVLLECQEATGGNGAMVVDVFGVGSSMQAGQGIEVDYMDVVNDELEVFSYKVDSQRWVDLCEASGANVDWLTDHGVAFSRVYSKTESNDLLVTHAIDGTLVGPMAVAAEAAGVEIRLQTRATELAMGDGAVKGVYAECADGSVLRVDAGAVVLATGGYGSNDQMMEERLSTDMANNLNITMPGHMGDGIRMAVAAGGKDMTADPVFMYYPCVANTGFDTICLTERGTLVWINQDGVRFTREDVGLLQPGYRALATTSQRTSYGLATKAILDAFAPMAPSGDVAATLDGLFASGADNVFVAQTLEELADMAPVDGDALLATVDAYNAMCDAGEDTQYRKATDQMVRIEGGPFYLFRWDLYFTTTLNGVHSSREAEVLDGHNEPVPGLYVAGVDGCELYCGFYTLSAGGSCNAYNVNSGRTAARNACRWLGIAG